MDEKINKLFDSFSTNYPAEVSFILYQLEPPKIGQRDSLYKPQSIQKLYLYRIIKGFNYYTKLTNYLNSNPIEARRLGFYKDENNNLQLPTKQHFNQFFQKHPHLIQELDLIAKKILQTATNKGILLDIELVKKTINKHKDKKEEQKKVFREATKLVKQLIYPQVDIKIKENGKFTTKDLLDILVHIAYSHDFTTNGSSTFQELYPELKAPSGDLMLYHFNKFDSIEQIKEMFDKIFDIIFNFARKNYKSLNRRKLNIAYDIHKIPYYGDPNNPYISESKHERGTSHFYQFLTCSIVVAGKRFVIDAIPIHKLDSIEELLDQSLEKVKQKINIEHAYFDRGFDSSKVINVIKKHKVKFIMPKVRSPTVKAWMMISEGCEARIVENFEIGSKEKALVNLVLVNDEEGIKRAFITNFHIPLQLTHYLYTWYSKRWGIETSYRQIDHDFKARTTTTNYHIRLFYFLFSVCLYNLWILVNICVSIKLNGRLPEKPIITAKLFAVVLYKVSYEDPPT